MQSRIVFTSELEPHLSGVVIYTWNNDVLDTGGSPFEKEVLGKLRILLLGCGFSGRGQEEQPSPSASRTVTHTSLNTSSISYFLKNF